MSRAINDHLTDLPISRQHRYQLRKRSEGRCIRCGQPAAGAGYYCEPHRQKNNIAARESQRRRLGLKNRYYDAESYSLLGSCPYGGYLFDAANTYLEAGRAARSPEAATGYLHGALLMSFGALEACINSLVEELDRRSFLTADEQVILRDRTVQYINGQYQLKHDSQVLRLEHRIEYLLERFSAEPWERESEYWREFQFALSLRDELLLKKHRLLD